MLPPITMHKSPRNQGLARDDLMTTTHSHGKVSFGRPKRQTSPKGEYHPSKYLKNRGSSDGEDEDDLERDHRDYLKEFSSLSNNNDRVMPGVSTENKIRQILMNENPDPETIEKQLSYLSKI